MEKYNSENLISSLLVTGFEKVDSELFTLVLGKISSEQRKNMQFKFVDKAFTEQFEEYVYCDEIDSHDTLGGSNLVRTLLKSTK